MNREDYIVATLAPVRESLKTPVGFRAWLDSKNSTDAVGNAQDDKDCPLVHYLREIHPTLRFQVNTLVRVFNHRPGSIYHYHVGCFVLPEWAHEFMCRIDESRVQTNITPKHAKRTLTLTLKEMDG